MSGRDSAKELQGRDSARRNSARNSVRKEFCQEGILPGMKSVRKWAVPGRGSARKCPEVLCQEGGVSFEVVCDVVVAVFFWAGAGPLGARTNRSRTCLLSRLLQSASQSLRLRRHRLRHRRRHYQRRHRLRRLSSPCACWRGSPPMTG